MAVPDKKLQQRLDHFVRVCREEGLRATHQRTEIFREVAASEAHPDAETVYQAVVQRVTGISRDTVYRTLATLEEHGLLRKTGGLGGPARFDANIAPHHHFVCKECGAITDFHSEQLDELPLPRAVHSLGRVDCAQVQVRGVCVNCDSRKRK